MLERNGAHGSVPAVPTSIEDATSKRWWADVRKIRSDTPFTHAQRAPANETERERDRRLIHEQIECADLVIWPFVDFHF